MGFMFVEIPFIQKSALYLGHPTYGFAVALFSLLLFGGLGSLLSVKVNLTSVIPVAAILVAIALLVAVMTVVTDHLFPATLSWPVAGRASLTVVLLAVAATPMGFPFPLGMAHLGRLRVEAIPWAWAMNGAASVLGSVVAMALAMAVGYRVSLLLAAFCYLCAAGALIWGRHSRPEASV
jgi:hypothetical protein